MNGMPQSAGWDRRLCALRWSFMFAVGTGATAFFPSNAFTVEPATQIAATTAAAAAKDSRIVAILKGHANWVMSIDVSPDGRSAVTAGQESDIRVWDLETGTLKQQLQKPGGCWSVVFSPDGKEVVAGHRANIVAFELATGKESWRFKAPNLNTYFSALQFDRTNHLVCGATNGIVYIWDYSKRDVPPLQVHAKRKLTDSHSVSRKHEPYFQACGLSPDGKLLALSSNTLMAASAEIELWDVATNKHLRTIVLDKGNVSHLEFSADGKRLVSSGHSLTSGWTDKGAIGSPKNEDSLILWDVEKGTILRKFAIAVPPPPPAPKNLPPNVAMAAPENTRIANHVKFSPDGKFIVTAERDHTLQLYAVDSSQPVSVVRGHSGEVRDLAFTPDGKRLVTVSTDGSGIVWDWQQLVGPSK